MISNAIHHWEFDCKKGRDEVTQEDLKELMVNIRERCETDSELTEQRVVELIEQGLRHYVKIPKEH